MNAIKFSELRLCSLNLLLVIFDPFNKAEHFSYTISSMLAKRLGARKVMALINRAAYVDLVQSNTIDIAISPQQATIGSLLAHVRKGDVVVVHSLRRGAAEAIEAIDMEEVLDAIIQSLLTKLSTLVKRETLTKLQTLTKLETLIKLEISPRIHFLNEIRCAFEFRISIDSKFCCHRSID